MDEEKCDSCDAALTEENKCSCEPSKCKECCTCPDDCDCGCKKDGAGEKTEETSEEVKPEADGVADEDVDDDDDDDEAVVDDAADDADKKEEEV